MTNAIAPAIDSTSTIGTAISKGAQAFANSVPNPLSGLDAIGAFFGGLTSANLWIRVLKGGIGAALLIVGVAHMTGADKAVGGAVGKAVKAAPFLL